MADGKGGEANDSMALDDPPVIPISQFPSHLLRLRLHSISCVSRPVCCETRFCQASSSVRSL